MKRGQVFSTLLAAGLLLVLLTGVGPAQAAIPQSPAFNGFTYPGPLAGRRQSGGR